LDPVVPGFALQATFFFLKLLSLRYYYIRRCHWLIDRPATKGFGGHTIFVDLLVKYIKRRLRICWSTYDVNMYRYMKIMYIRCLPHKYNCQLAN
jgi:hypothetical protein